MEEATQLLAWPSFKVGYTFNEPHQNSHYKKFDFRRGYFAEVVRNLDKLTLLGMILQII